MNATTAGIPVVLGPEGYENQLSLWKVKTRVQASGINGETREPFSKDWNIVAGGPEDAVPKVYSKYSSGKGRFKDLFSQQGEWVIVTKIEILGIEWLNSIDITE